jgi:hypothetical protein
MTEAEWLNLDDPYPRQLSIIHEVASPRKLRLIAAVCARGCQRHPTNEGKHCDDLIEIVADTPRPWAEIETELRTRPGHWGLTGAMYEQGPDRIAKDLRRLVSMYPCDPAWTVRNLVQLIHEVVGNPFHPVTFSPSWRTDTAVSLARQMYHSREFSAMPILADALQDAGCDSDDILSHCRGDGPHVRGCWVVDLVLDKN